ncbi:MAG: PAS domain-containing sensor histidine kinase, partial [Rhizobiaceae bacterium]|nr:PAS domain-containing sensor histidine kinase [Rhizobiaceae bacterium]
MGRKIGLATVIALMITGTLSFLVLIGLTPINPNNQYIVYSAAAVNGILILVLVFLIVREVLKILRSRAKGRAASRLHVRIIGLFCLVAAFPAVLVAIVAGVTLDLGLDRWFEIRTKRIVESSVSIARAYRNESTRVLLGNTLSMASNLDRNRRLYVLDRFGFESLFELETRGRGFLYAAIINTKGETQFEATLNEEQDIPKPPEIALELADKGDPVPTPPNNNLIGAVFKLRQIPNSYLYSVIAIHPAVNDAIESTRINSEEYNNLEENRFPVQLAFALLYLGVCVIVLLCAIWMGISVATRIVTPIRRLIGTANEVSGGNLDVAVDVSQSEGDLRFLGETFNEMLGDLRHQQSELVEANTLMDQRARFIEAVLSGVSASVVGLSQDGKITINNRSASPLLFGHDQKVIENAQLHDIAPELGEVFDRAVSSGQSQYHEQIAFVREGRERTYNVQVTMEEETTESHSFVLTLDDITDLVSAQRNTAWADVARRIAHEIKNPLTPIQLSAERIKRRYGRQISDDDREVFDNCTDTIIRQVGDIGRMVDEFSSFARMPAPEMVEGNIKKTIRETVFLQKVGFPEIDIQLQMPDEAVSVVYDERMISQSLINVIKNAAEAIEGKEGDEKGKIEVNLSIENERARLDIIDNGKGLPETDRQKLLEPYMTTREKGTGLGLPIVRKIIEDHGGSIELMDSP